MATIKQRKLVKKVIENYGNVSKSMREVGYSDNSARNPQIITETKGYKEVLKESGLTEELISSALVEDIKAKPQKRHSELNLGAEILGMKKIVDKPGDGNVHFHFHKDEKILQVVNKAEEDIMNQLKQDE